MNTFGVPKGFTRFATVDQTAIMIAPILTDVNVIYKSDNANLNKKKKTSFSDESYG